MIPTLDQLALRILIEEPVTDFAPDILPCRGCEEGLGHLRRAGVVVWDLHERPLPGAQGRVFEECTAPTRAMIRAWIAKRELREGYRSAVQGTAV